MLSDQLLTNVVDETRTENLKHLGNILKREFEKKIQGHLLEKQ